MTQLAPRDWVSMGDYAQAAVLGSRHCNRIEGIGNCIGKIRMRRTLLAALLISVGTSALIAQDPVKVGDVSIAGSLRTRIESWDWFQGNAHNDYTFAGSILRLSVAESKKQFDWQMEFALPFLLGLPDNAVATGTQGQLGLGASYFVANDSNRNASLPFVKQGFVKFKGLGGVEGQSLKVGRMEFIDGTEVTPANSTLATLKRDRIAARLLGNFAFSDVGRSFDGIQHALNGSKLNLTMFGGRPTRGVYQVDGWGELNINVFYGALTGQFGDKKRANEWRVFGLGYSDDRNGIVKTDDRPLAIRKADTGRINIGTYGGHFLHTTETKSGAIDFMFWGALQNGTWGAQVQRAGAFAAEAGWQPPILSRVKPWIRGGYDFGSGDKNPNDSTHGTFFQVLPTPRIYARFPFFNMMNTRDAFGELMLRPSKRVTIRSDVHSLALANSSDLWYTGGGAFQPWTFGYTGRASGGNSGLATLYDSTVDFNCNRHFTAGLYYGYAAGKLVMQSIYPTGKDANFGFVELTYKF
jgi:Alginate export